MRTVFLCVAALLVALPATAQNYGLVGDAVVLQGLDKVTARVERFVAPVGLEVSFGTLKITARACHKTPPEEPPEVAAFLDIDDARPEQPRADAFDGWMFASSPGLSALAHPVYDVWVIDCRNPVPSTP